MVNPCNAKKVADKVLEDFDDVCNALSIRYCLILGTCLGFYRDGGYIPRDNDIDVWVDCALPRDRNFVALAKQLESMEFAREGPRHFWRDGILLDVWRIASSATVAPLSFVETFDTIVYNGRTYNLPHPVEGYLECKYGPDWKTLKPRRYR